MHNNELTPGEPLAQVPDTTVIKLNSNTIDTFGRMLLLHTSHLLQLRGLVIG